MPLTHKFDEKVEVAFVPVPRTSIKPLKVEVAVVEVAVKYWATASPTTESFAYGEVVPMPTFPVPLILSNSVPAP